MSLSLASPGGIQALQRLAGNDAVQRLAVQLQDEDGVAADSDQAAGPSPALFEGAFSPDDIVAEMAGMGAGAADLAPNPGQVDDGATAQALFVQRDDPPGPSGPGLPAEAAPAKSGSVGDVLSALAAVPEIKAALDKLKQLVIAQWDAFVKGTSPGEKAVTFGVAGAIALGALGGVGSDPTARKKAVDLLNGVKIPVPIPGLNGGLWITPQTKDGALKGGSVGVDLCKVVPGMANSPMCN